MQKKRARAILRKIFYFVSTVRMTAEKDDALEHELEDQLDHLDDVETVAKKEKKSDKQSSEEET